jgi:hypothetical protein
MNKPLRQQLIDMAIVPLNILWSLLVIGVLIGVLVLAAHGARYLGADLSPLAGAVAATVAIFVVEFLRLIPAAADFEGGVVGGCLINMAASATWFFAVVL